MGGDRVRLSWGRGNFRRRGEMILNTIQWEEQVSSVQLAEQGFLQASQPSGVTCWEGEGVCKGTVFVACLSSGRVHRLCISLLRLSWGNSQIELVSWMWVKNSQPGKQPTDELGVTLGLHLFVDAQHFLFKVEGFFEKVTYKWSWSIFFPSCIKLHSRAGF